MAVSLLDMESRKRAILFLLGSGADVGELQELAQDLRVEGMIRFVERVPHADVPRYIAACDCGVIPLPDLREWQVSSPLKLMEYLAMEKPVIATRIPPHELGTDGVILTSAEPKSLATAMGELLEMPPEERERRGREGRRLAYEHSWDRQAARLLGFFAMLGIRT